MSFGEIVEGKSFKILDERQIRASAGIMFLLGLIAFINGFFLQNFKVLPIISGILMLNFIIGIFVGTKYAPTLVIAKMIVKGQSKLPIGAIQKKFAWGLGLTLSTAIFVLSLFLINDIAFFDKVCLLCLICLVLLFLETAFGICVGCELYHSAIKYKLIKKPEENPNCMGDSCEV